MAKQRAEDVKVTRGSGNVFADLGFENAEEVQAKANLVRTLQNIIENRKLSIRAASKIIKIDNSDLSQLLRGRTRGYSIERLFRFLLTLDRDIEIRIKKRPKSRDKGRIFVESA